MTKWILAALTTVLATVGLTSLAQAAPAATAEGDIPIAEAFWSGPPTQCTSLTIGFAPEPGALGDATQPTPGWSGPCEMQLSEVGPKFSPESVCLIVVHEEGHLHGFGHVANPEAIMYGGGGLSAAEVPACVEPPESPEPPEDASNIPFPKWERAWRHTRHHRLSSRRAVS